jgi:hypothetical protein
MRIRRFALSVALLAASVFAASAFARNAGSAGPCASGNVASTASYRLALDIGKQEDMYLPSEVKARHIKTGEVMLGGEMSMTGNPPAGSRVYHLEVHTCNKATGAVAQKLKPAIVVDGSSASVMDTTLPAAIMVGIGAPMTDYHYGNDIVLNPGTRVTVKVTVKGQLAVFHATVPKL